MKSALRESTWTQKSAISVLKKDYPSYKVCITSKKKCKTGAKSVHFILTINVQKVPQMHTLHTHAHFWESQHMFAPPMLGAKHFHQSIHIVCLLLECGWAMTCCSALRGVTLGAESQISRGRVDVYSNGVPSPSQDGCMEICN